MREFINIVEDAETRSALEAKLAEMGWGSLTPTEKFKLSAYRRAGSEPSEPAPSGNKSLSALLSNWSDGYNADDVWTGARMDFDKEIIEACSGLNHKVEGVLYRGQGISDQAFDGLMNGSSSMTDPTKTLLTSWTKSQKIAEGFAKVANENHGMNAVVIAYPASELKIVVDFDQIPGLDNPEHEVLCMHAEIPLNASTVVQNFKWEDE